jgi:hypothetical protein
MYKIAILAAGAIAVSGWLRAQQTKPDSSFSPAAAAADTANLAPNTPKPRATSGAAGFIGMFSDTTDLADSAMYQYGTRIGLNTTLPYDFLHVVFNDSSGAFTGYAVQNVNAAGFSGMLFYDQNGALAQFQGFGNTTHEYRINNIASNGSINFLIGGSSKFLVTNSGNIGIGTGTTTLSHLLQVAGSIGAQEVVVSQTGADYVFDPGYKLQPLSEVAAYINENHHLPEIPSAGEMQEKGMSVGDMQAKLLAKIEELTLHMIQAEEKSNRLERENRELRERLDRLEAGSGHVPSN